MRQAARSQHAATRTRPSAPSAAGVAQKSPAAQDAGKGWCLYLIECRNGSWYAGITNRLEARYAAHAVGRGARYTRANPPVRLLGFRSYPDRASASRAEWQIKQLPRNRKLAFLETTGAHEASLFEPAG
jgi:putative endonuclease